ncbi:MAG TPA: hypothetical protein VHM25_20005 [Polyangiaceae bacterium]|nr:hypothetical protein [Polyangiaceae bacterium]
MRKFSVRALLWGCLSCTVLLSASSSFAAPAARAGDEDTTVAIARERFKEGVAFFDQKQYDKARVAFLQAYALKKHPAVLLNLAQSELRCGHEVDAAKHFSAYLRESTTASDAERQAAEAGLNATKSAVALLDVNVDESGTEIYVDGNLEGISPLPGALYVTPGPHTVEARKGGKTKTQAINASAGRQFLAELSFAPKTLPAQPAVAATNANANKGAPSTEEPAPPPEPEQPAAPSAGRKPFFKWLVTSPVGVVGLSLTGVGVGGGIGLAVASKKSYDNADSIAAQITHAASQDSMMANPDTRDLCNNPSSWLMKQPSPPSDISARAGQYNAACSKYQDNVHSGDQMKTWSTVGFVVGGVAAVGTVILYFVDPNARVSTEAEARRERQRLAIVPSVGPAQTGLTVMGSF